MAMIFSFSTETETIKNMFMKQQFNIRWLENELEMVPDGKFKLKH